jgi:RNA polymerase sigma-70 factor, ECF subfamily
VTSQIDDLAAARRGDAEAFGRLIDARSARLARLARSIVGDADAADVTQDSCLACWRHLGQLDDLTKFDSWLMRIVYTTALRRARWQRVRALVFAAPASAAGGLDPAQPAADPTDGIFVWEALSRLPARQRAVLHLTVVEGLTDAEIAASLGIRAGSVRAHRRRARERVESLWHDAL